jgi:hypothetical protein
MSAAQIIIEEETGTYTGRRHPHNGYYAGDFWTGSSAADDRTSPRTDDHRHTEDRPWD